MGGTLRDDCLNLHWFLSLADAKRTMEDWRLDCNEVRPRSSLGGLTPADYAEQHSGEEATLIPTTCSGVPE